MSTKASKMALRKPLVTGNTFSAASKAVPITYGMVFFCDFCGKDQHQAEVMVRGRYRGRNTPAICNECVDMAGAAVSERRRELAEPTQAEPR